MLKFKFNIVTNNIVLRKIQFKYKTNMFRLMSLQILYLMI